MNAAELMRLRSENKELRDQVGQMRRERDRAVIAGSLFVCDVDDREGTPAAVVDQEETPHVYRSTCGLDCNGEETPC